MQPEREIWLNNRISPVVAKWLSQSAGYKVILSYKMRLFERNDREICLMAKKMAVLSGFEKKLIRAKLSPNQALLQN